jgi:hypothetical protein
MTSRRDAVFMQRYIYSGRAAADAASRMADSGRSGLVVDVRFPYLHVLRGISRNWFELVVTVTGQGFRSFGPNSGKAGLAWEIETDLERVDVTVRNLAHESMKETIELQPGRVRIVVVHPRLQRFSIGPKHGIVTEGNRVVR